MSYGEAHYANGLVDGAYSLRLFGEAVTEMSITLDHDEGLLAAYHDVQFHEPIHCGDILDVVGTLVEKGTRSRRVKLSCTIAARSTVGQISSASAILATPILATEAMATFVIPAAAK